MPFGEERAGEGKIEIDVSDKMLPLDHVPKPIVPPWPNVASKLYCCHQYQR